MLELDMCMNTGMDAENFLNSEWMHRIFQDFERTQSILLAHIRWGQ